MEINFVQNYKKTKTALLQINNARLCFRNFRGEGSKYNDEGKRNFSVIIPDEEIAEALKNDVNEYGVGWNVKIKAPEEPGEMPFMHMKVNVSYSERSKPDIYVVSGNNKRMLTEETIHMLDDITIEHVDLDIRPYDDEGRMGPFRSAYLQAIWVTQAVDRFAARFAEDEEHYN